MFSEIPNSNIVDAKIREALTNYPTKEDVDNAMKSKQDTLTLQQTNAVNSGVTKEHVDKLENIEEGAQRNPDLSGFAKKTDLEGFAKNTELDKFAKKTELEVLAKKTDLEGLATKAEIIEGFAKKTDLEALAKKTDLEGFATEADLLAFYYPDGNVTSMSQITTSGIEYAVGSDGGAYVASGNGLSGHVVLPWKVTIGGNEYKVTAVGESAFNINVYSNSFTSFIAPITVKSIGNSAFRDCSSLTSIDIPSATSIGPVAFGGCSSLTSIDIPFATSIGPVAFGNCSSLTSINIPSATSIGDYAFEICSSLTSIDIPSATSIGDYAFDSCSSFTSIDIPSATSIGTSAFNLCGSLASVDFGSSPKSAVPSLSGSAFEGVPTSCKFIIPLGMYDEWIAASGWSDLYAQGYKFEGYASTAQLANKADKATTLAGYGITDGATKESLAPEYSPSSAYAVGALVYHDGNIYQCTTEIADGGEAWSSEHWELRKLDDFFTESNSLLNGSLAYKRNATGLKDRAFNALTFDGTEYNLSTALAAVTPTASGQPRDLLIVATATAATTISFTDGTIKGDKPTIDGSGTWLITLTEYASGVWYCRQIKMEDAA